MLQKMHEKIKGWVAAVIIGLLCVVFVLWGVEYYVNGSRSAGKVLVEVAGKKVTENEVNDLVRKLQQQASEQGFSLNESLNQQIKEMALQNLISEIALSQAAIKEGFIAPIPQVEQLIMQIPVFQENGQFSLQRFQQYLYASNITQQQLVAQLQKSVLIDQVSVGIKGSTFLLPSETQYFYNLFFQRRTFQYLTIPARQFVSQVKVTPQLEKNYYDNNKESLRIPEQVSIDYIELSPTQVMQTMQIPDAELKQYYEDHLANYRIPNTWRFEQILMPVTENAPSQQVQSARDNMNHVLQQMKQGSSFKELFQQYKGTTETLSENSDRVTPELLSVLKGLQPGQISQPFSGPQGFSIIRLLSYVPEKTKSFNEVKGSIKTLLTQQKAQKFIATQNERLSNLTFTNPDSLLPAAKALHIQVQTSPLFTAQGVVKGIASNPEIVSAAFSKEVLQNKNNSNPIFLKDGRVIVLRVNQYLPSNIPVYEKAQPQIHEKLIQQLTEAKAALFATEIQNLLTQGKSVDVLLKKNHLSWTIKNNIQHDNNQIPDIILSAAFNLSLNKENNSTTVALPSGDAVVVRLLKVNKPDFKIISSNEKQQFQQKMQSMLGEMNYQLYAIGIQKNTTKKFIND